MKKIYFSFLFVCLAVANINAQCSVGGCVNNPVGRNYFWVGTGGGAGDYNCASNWRLDSPTSGIIPCQPPQSSNNVYFMASVFLGNKNISVLADSKCKNMFWDGNITPANRPTLSSPVNVTMDIYDTLTLAGTNSLVFNFRGDWVMRGSSATARELPIYTAGQRFITRAVILQGDANTTYTLTENFYLDDPAQITNGENGNLSQGLFYLQSGGFDSKGYDMRVDFFYSRSGVANRRINISNSRIEVWGRSGSNSWGMDLTNTPALNYSSFIATGSHIVLLTDPISTNGCAFNAGIGVQYDTVTIKATATRSHIPNTFSGRPLINHVFLQEGTQFVNAQPTIDNLYLWANRAYGFGDGSIASIWTVDNIMVQHQCNSDMALVFANNAPPRIKKKTPGALVTSNLILHDAIGDISNGSTYTANNSAKAGNTTNWTVNAPVSRVMRFKGDNISNAAPQNWHQTENWQEKDGMGNWINSTCLPSAVDDVYFDGQSFFAFTTGSTSNTNKHVKIDSLAFCRGMYWLSAPDNDHAELRLHYKKGVLHLFGTLQMAPDAIRDTVFTYINTSTSNRVTFDAILSGANADQGTMMFFGGESAMNLDTIISNGVHLMPTLYIADNAHYRIADTLSAFTLSGAGESTIYTTEVGMELDRMYLGARFMHNTRVLLQGVYNSGNSFREAFIDRGGVSTISAANPHYSGTTTFIFDPAIPRSGIVGVGGTNHLIDGITYRSEAHLPNTIFKKPMESANDFIVHGDLRFEDNANMYQALTTANAVKIRVTGWMKNIGSPYNGDVFFEAGKSYITTSGATNSDVRIDGNFYSIGTCSKNITINTLNNSPVTVRVFGQDSIVRTTISNWNNIGTAVLTAYGSVDGGGNTRIDIDSITPRTFYWRANAYNAADFGGDWSNPAHWTVIASNIVGDNDCLPTLQDTVVFDGLSGAATDTCYANNGFCAVFWYKNSANNKIASPRSSTNPTLHAYGTGTIDIAKHWWIENDKTVQFQNFTGKWNLVGSGIKDIDLGSTILYPLMVEIKDVNGVWELQSALRLKIPFTSTHPSISGEQTYAALLLTGGTLNTNNQELHLYNQFAATGSLQKTLNLSNSNVYVYCEGVVFLGSGANGSFPWYVANGTTNLTISSGTGNVIHFYNNTLSSNSSSRTLRMGNTTLTGNNIHYNDIKLYLTDEVCTIDGTAWYRNMYLNGNTQIANDNYIDTLRMNAPYTYYFEDDSKQTISAPFGTILVNTSANNFVNIETYPANTGKRSKFHKEWGDYLCLDYIRVRDNEVTRNEALCITNGTTDMYFYAGENSDNINNSATGHWRFTLGFANHTISTNDVQLCQTTDTAKVSLWVVGEDLEGYYIKYQWHDINGNVASVLYEELVNDNDGDANTPFVFSKDTVVAQSGFFAFSVGVVRCGDTTSLVNDTAQIFVPNPNPLINIASQGQCFLSNKAVWVDFYDDLLGKPIASVLDNVLDSDSLKMTTAYVDIDASITACNGGLLGVRPRLPRYWQITPENNKAAFVRLYFTQAELAALSAATLSPSLSLVDLELWKFEDGQLCNATPVVVPFTVIDLSASSLGYPNDKAFTTTSGVYAIEFEVSSFSHFVLVPLDILLAADFTHFFAQVTPQRNTQIDWGVENNESFESFTVQRSKDAIHFEDLMLVPAQNATQQANYLQMDEQPFDGVSYYRVKGLKRSGNQVFTDIKSVLIGDNSSVFNLFPNPILQGNQISVRALSPHSGIATVEIFDPLGRNIHTQQISTCQGTQIYNVSTAQMNSGTYILRWSTSDYTQQCVFVVD